MLLGREAFDSGMVDYGAQVDVGYFDQMQSNLDLNKTALDEIWDTFPNMTETKLRTALGCFLFKGDEVFKPLSKMSGGERARVSLLKLMLEGSNFLLLDEPTNHLDSSSREQLETTLQNYEGTMLIISHDRYFINKLATRILELSENGVKEYLGNYDYYSEHKANTENVENASKKAADKKPNDYALEKQKRAKERKLKNDLQKAEALIEKLDGEIAELNETLQSEDVVSDFEKLTELTEMLEQKQIELEKAYENWEALTSQD